MEETDLEPRLAALIAAVSGLGLRCSRLSRTLARLARPGALADARALESIAQVLAGQDLVGTALEGEAREVADHVTRVRTERVDALRFEFQRDLAALMKAVGVDLAVIDEKAVEYRASPFTIKADFASFEASVLYARQCIRSKLPLSAQSVSEAWQAAIKEFSRSGDERKAFRETLMSSYRALVARRGLAPGERVDLVDLWPEVALALQPDRFFKDPAPRTFRAYPRWRFAADLAGLRAAGLLAGPQSRISLGSATAGSTAQKARVVWIEDDAGAGQYYLTFHVVRAAAGTGGSAESMADAGAKASAATGSGEGAGQR